MTFPRFWSMLAVVCFIVPQFVSPSFSRADTYSLNLLMSDEHRNFYGMDDIGHVVINDIACDQFNSGSCYYSFLNGSLISTTSTAPAFAFDYASVLCLQAPCSVSFKGRTASFVYDINHVLQQLFVSSGSDPAQLLTQFNGVTGVLAINGVGDIVFANGTTENWYEEIDVTSLSSRATPEPSSLLLLGTGIAAGAGLVRRKLLV